MDAWRQRWARPHLPLDLPLDFAALFIDQVTSNKGLNVIGLTSHFDY